jgi:transposase
MWCVPDLDAEYTKRMMDVLEVYERPYDPKRPVVCVYEKSAQLLEDKRPSTPTQPGSPRKKDYEYVRRGTANLFCGVEPKGQRRTVQVTAQRRASDFAEYMAHLAKTVYASAEKIVVVMDNLNTHKEKSFIERYGEKVGSTLWNRLEIHYTPKHASWLNMAEIEIGVLTRQCLQKRRSSIADLRKHVSAWEKRRNRDKKGITWSFTRKRAHKKFRLNEVYQN